MSKSVRAPSQNDSTDCPPEWVLSVYVDRELEPAALRETEVHLVRCLACRERVMSLEVEAGILRSALHHEEAPEAPAIEAAPARGFVVGMGPAVAAAFACVSALSWVIDTQMPAPMEWLNPINLSGAFTMFFDTAFMLRDEAPALYQLVLSSAALFSVAFLLTTLVTALTRRVTNPGAMVSFVVGCLMATGWLDVSTADAVELRFHGEEHVISEGEVVEATWVTSAEEVIIAGTLRGDLIVFAERVIISGELDGNLFAIARKVEISGQVKGSISTFGERVRVSGRIDRNVYSLADETVISESGEVARDVVAGGDGVVLSGKIGRDVLTFSGWLEARGEIAGDLVANAEHIEVLDAARIGGDLHARFLEEHENLEISSQAVIEGETTRETVEIDHPNLMDRYTSFHFYLFILLSFVAAFITGMVLFRFSPWVFGGHLESGSEFFRAMAFGFVALVAVPLFLILTGLTVVGIPLALMGFALFAMGVYFAEIIVGGTLGMAIFGEPDANDWTGFGVPLAAGLGVVVVASAIPFLGGLVGFVTLLTGLGMLVEQLRNRFWAA